MKKWLLIISLGLTIQACAQTINTIAIVDTSNLFQQIAQKTGISLKLENEFKSQMNELKREENDLKKKIEYLQRNGSSMKVSERNKLEKEAILQRQSFSQKAQIFEQDRQRRSNEEREKVITCIQNTVKKIAIKNHIDLVIDISAIIFNNVVNVKDITYDVLRQVQ